MHLANVMLAIGGDTGTTIPKRAVTAAEIAVLRSIHGEEAVFDVEACGEVNRSHRDERARLKEIYGGAEDGNGGKIVDGLFPGAAARVFDTLDELELPEVLFKVERSAPVVAAEKPKRSKKAAQTEATSVAGDLGLSADDEDGIEDITE